MLKIIIIAIAIAWMAMEILQKFERINTFFPESDFDASTEDFSTGLEDIYFEAKDGTKLHGWFLPAPESRSILIFAHGNAGNISHRIQKIQLLNKIGISVFIFDYRGYGKSFGKPTEKGMYRDIAGAVSLVKGRLRSPADKLIFYGESLGGAAVIDYLYEYPEDQKHSLVILEGTFTSAVDMAKIIYPFIPSFIVRTRLDNASKIAHLKAPLLILHSTNDPVVPYKFGQKLYDLAGVPKKIVALSGGHCTAFAEETDLYLVSIRDFVASYGTDSSISSDKPGHNFKLVDEQ